MLKPFWGSSTPAPPPPVPAPLPPLPGIPVLLKRTDTSLILAWTETKDDTTRPEMDVLSDNVDLKDCEFDLRFVNRKHTYSSWQTIGLVTSKTWVEVRGLEPGMAYVFQIRARVKTEEIPSAWAENWVDVTKTKVIKVRDKVDCKWTEFTPASKPLRTLTLDEQQRIDNLFRLRLFILEGAKGLEPYGEDAAVPDTYSAKATRTFEGVLTAVASTGLGGAYISLVKNAWRVHKTGLASLIFHPDLQKTVYVLLTFLNTVAASIGLSSKDVVVGSYFAIWEAKRQRLLHPLAEHDEHSFGALGVLEPTVPKKLLDELMFYFPLTGLVYRKSPAQVQWVLNKFQGGGYRLVCSRTTAEKFQPSYFLAANEPTKTAVFVIRGTSELEDLVTDGLCEVSVAPFTFDKGHDGQSRVFHVHAGFLHAARWLVRGDDRRRNMTFVDVDKEAEELEAKKVKFDGTATPPQTTEEENDDNRPDGAGIGAAVAKLWAGGYRRVVFAGHSLGGGVAILAALLIADRFPELSINVYGYGTPAVVDEYLAEACKGKRSAVMVPQLGHRVTVKNIIRHDDLIPRLSILTARDFAKHLMETRSQWSPLLNEDITSFTERVKTVWAPAQRAHSISRGGPAQRVQKLIDAKMSASQAEAAEAAMAMTTTMLDESKVADGGSSTSSPALASGATTPMEEVRPSLVQSLSASIMSTLGSSKASSSQQAIIDRLEKTFSNRLVVPGLIVHTYKMHGTHQAALVDYSFPPLRRISAFQNCIDDHRFDEIMIAVRSVYFAQAANERGHHPPHWESMLDHANDEEEWQVRCRVCTYPVSWHHTSSSEAFEIRATHHCHSCGRIVCSKCSEARIALPQIGIITPVRVCDICKYKIDGNEGGVMISEQDEDVGAGRREDDGKTTGADPEKFEY